jgi:hypothetical protein
VVQYYHKEGLDTNVIKSYGSFAKVCFTVLFEENLSIFFMWLYVRELTLLHEYRTELLPTCMLTKTPWYVSYNCLFILAVKGISKGNSVFPAGVESQKKYKSFKSFEKRTFYTVCWKQQIYHKKQTWPRAQVCPRTCRSRVH